MQHVVATEERRLSGAVFADEEGDGAQAGALFSCETAHIGQHEFAGHAHLCAPRPTIVGAGCPRKLIAQLPVAGFPLLPGVVFFHGPWRRAFLVEGVYAGSGGGGAEEGGYGPGGVVEGFVNRAVRRPR